MTSLMYLDLSHNDIGGGIPSSIGKLENMVVLYLGNNQLQGIVSEAHFSKITKLKGLDLSYNSFTLNVSSNWIPPFQVQRLLMGSCILGPSFPSWLKSQKEVRVLDFSNASISSSIPSWFWNISSNLSVMEISHNELQGTLPNPLSVSDNVDIDLSFNLLDGPIPLATARINALDLSHNYFFGPIPKNLIENVLNESIFISLSSNQLYGEIPTSIGLIASVFLIDLSNNSFTGRIPSSLANCSSLNAIDLGSNNLFGAIPNSLGQLQRLGILRLSNNNLSGNLPSSLFNISFLQAMDLANNEFSGKIPSWNGDGNLELRILNLRSNAFSGEIPSELSKLSSLQFLDLGDNDLSGSIPASLGDLKAMAKEQKLTRYVIYGIGNYSGGYYEESLVVETKGQSLYYTKTLSLVTSIDLSRNNLSGRFPQEITKLSSLVNLDLSGNHITGNIPRSISNLHQLQSLDLSSNKFSGTIPSSLSSLFFLSYLNLSNNNLTGAIPYTGQTTTFDAPSFVGNPGLCGPPLPLSSRCLDDEDHGHGFDKGASIEEKYDDEFIDSWFYLSLGLGFAVGILVPYIILAMKRSWSDAYFDFLDTVVYELFMLIHGRRNKPRPRQ